MIWTALSEDTLQQCRQAIATCEERRIRPAPWFTMLVDLYEELERAGLILKVKVKQDICEGCVWALEDDEDSEEVRPCEELMHCAQHFSLAHIDRQTGKVMFCPHKTTEAMRAAQLKLHKRRGPVHNRPQGIQQKAEPPVQVAKK